jgi:hypothetical protein
MPETEILEEAEGSIAWSWQQNPHVLVSFVYFLIVCKDDLFVLSLCFDGRIYEETKILSYNDLFLFASDFPLWRCPAATVGSCPSTMQPHFLSHP